MDRMQLLETDIVALLMAGGGLSLNGRYYASGLLIAMFGLLVVFLTFGFVVKVFV